MSDKIPISENGIPLGEHHHRAKYSDALVAYLRRLHEEEHLSWRAIAKLHPEISEHTVRAIVQYKRRNNVPRGYRDSD